ncbi:MAG: GAF domain-containing protein, partial [Chloroflexi bacterium]|nr:GAF domain-containing protein [Chloroflexota bacterium]
YQNTRKELTEGLSDNLRNVSQVQAAAIGNLLVRQVNLLQSLGSSKTIQDMAVACNEAHCGDPQVQTDLAALEAEWQQANAAHTDSDPLVQSVINNSAAVEINSFRESFPDNLEVIATNQYGLVLAASNRTTRYSYINETWWRKAYDNGRGNIYIGEPELIPNINQYAFIVAVPIRSSGTRQVIGVLRTAVRLLPARDLLASAQIGQTGQTALVFRAGKVLNDRGVLEQWPSSNILQLSDTPMTEVMQMPLGEDNQQRIVSQARVESSDPALGDFIFTLQWRVVVSIEPAEALAPVNQAALTNLMISLGILAISGLLALVLTQYLTGPILRLTAVAERVRSGDLSARARVESEDEIGVLAQTFNQTTSQLSDQINTLEQRVADRTQDLQRQTLRLRVASEVARDAAASPNLDELLSRSSLLIRDRFNFYHTGIFLLDEKKVYAVLRASPTEAGREMMANNHRLKIGEQGIVGRVAATGEPRIALDVGADAVFFNNPMLPATRSEMALPLKTAEGVIGVLDVQSDEPEAFTQDDIAIIQTMADQLATAIERLRLFHRVESNLREMEKTYSEFTNRSWTAFTRGGTQNLGYKFDNIRLEAVHQVPEEAKEAIKKGGVVLRQRSGKEADAGQTAAIPIRLRGQTIGAINVRFQSEEISDKTISMIEQAADRLATALENARLLEETRQRAQRDALVSELTGRLRSTLDVETVLRTATQELQKAFELKEVEVRLGVPPANEPETQSKPRKNGKRGE